MTEGERKLVNVGAVKEGTFVIIDNEPCRIVSMQHSKSGKHGHAKYRITAVGINDNKKREIIMPGSDNIEVPIIDKRNAQVLSTSGNIANVMDNENYETLDLEIPSELKDDVKEGVIVVYWIILNKKTIKQIKTD